MIIKILSQALLLASLIIASTIQENPIIAAPNIQEVPIIAPTIQESPIIAQAIHNCKIYSEKSLNSAIGELIAGQSVEILEDFSYKVYKVLANDIIGWVKAQDIKIPPETQADRSVVSKEGLEDFVNNANYSSSTNYLILTEINRQKTHVFTKNNKAWQLSKTFSCSTGLNISPTTRGIFKISDRSPWFYSDRLAAGARYWMRFNGQYLFHSTPMDKHKNIIPQENKVGEKRSSGCIRLMLDDAKWLYQNIPKDTTVVII